MRTRTISVEVTVSRTHTCYVPSRYSLVIPDFSLVVARLRQLWIACDPERLRHRTLARHPQRAAH